MIKHVLALFLFSQFSFLACSSHAGISGLFVVSVNSPGEQPKIDSLVIYKAERKMKTFAKGKLVKTYHIALGSNAIGKKQFQGDGKTPEGLYFIDGKNPNSDYHKNLGISYPNSQDTEHARKNGRSPGGDIKIHGYPNGYTHFDIKNLAKDWTIGCIAVTNKEIDELYQTVPIGTPVLILP